MNNQISLKFHAVCAASKVLQNYNDLGHARFCLGNFIGDCALRVNYNDKNEKH